MKHLRTDWGDTLDVRYYLRERLRELHGRRVLDAACNQGVLLAAVPMDNSKVGFDIRAQAVAHAKALLPDATVVQASLYDIPYPARSFDVVIAAHVVPAADFAEPAGKRAELQHRFVSEIARVLRPGGTLFLTTPNAARYPGGVKMTRAQLQALLEPFFDFQLGGYNPFPSFPFFPPARFLALVPGWRWLLGKLCEWRVGVNRSKAFFVKAKRK